MGPEQRSEGLNHLVELAQQGNEIAKDLIKESMILVGEVVGQLANSLDIRQIVCGGPQWEQVKDFAEEGMSEAIRRRFALRQVHDIETRTSVLGSKIGAIGGACAVMDASLSPKAPPCCCAKSDGPPRAGPRPARYWGAVTKKKSHSTTVECDFFLKVCPWPESNRRPTL